MLYEFLFYRVSLSLFYKPLFNLIFIVSNCYLSLNLIPQMIMKTIQLNSSTENRNDYINTLANRIHNGFEIVENNDKLPFAVLSKKGVKVNHSINFILFCATLGLWSLPWIYISHSSKEKKIIIAIDEDGRTFEEKCYN